MVGRCPTRSIQKLTELPGVSLAANVPDVRPYLRRASIAIAPLRIARGIQNKVLEAMSLGKAVVATAGSAAGIKFESGVHFVQADTPHEWISALQSLWTSEAERSRLGSAGRRFVEMHHAWASTLEPWESLIRASMQEHQATNSSQVSKPVARIYGIAQGESQEHSSRSESLHRVTGHEQAK